ncbi:creatininase family protein [Anaerocolumna jejuensis]|uniref:creatininase family protein n=1 Tax=Anaerocolumna jejuensis TaxID=259063 RepID=UPI003F7BD5E0
MLFPLGVIEEHGPHLPLGTDSYWSYASSRGILEELNKKGRAGFDCSTILLGN